MKSKGLFLAIIMFLILAFVPAAQAQHGHNSHGQVNHSHAGQAEHGVSYGHGRNEGRAIDEHYRSGYFGHSHRVLVGGFYGRRTFQFGGIWFGLDVWPAYWYASDYVYVEYYDGDYFLVNERFPSNRVAIVIE
jgi:hypothetical protein